MLSSALMLMSSLLAAPAAAAGAPGGQYGDEPCALSDLVGHNWTYIAPAAFRGGTWNNDHGCVYHFRACGAQCFEFVSPPQCLSDQLGKDGVKATLGPPGAAPGGQQLVSLQYGKGQVGCSTLPGVQCSTPSGETVKCPVAQGDNVCGCPGATAACKPCHTCQKCTSGDVGGMQSAHKVGWMSARCSLIDVEDGGMYVRGNPDGRSHPMDFAPHEWLRLAAAWVVRSAIVTFSEDQSRHLTPGIPIAPNAKPHYYGYW